MADYCKHLASILRKAQGVIDAETNQPIDVGEECVALRQECDALRAQLAARDEEVGRLREAAQALESEVRGVVPDIKCYEACADGLSVCQNAHARLLLIRACDNLRAALQGEGSGNG